MAQTENIYCTETRHTARRKDTDRYMLHKDKTHIAQRQDVLKREKTQIHLAQKQDTYCTETRHTAKRQDIVKTCIQSTA